MSHQDTNRWIDERQVYTLDEFKRRVALSDGALRRARRDGLRVRYAHRRGYVLGDDWIRYLQSLDPDQDDAAAEGRGDAG